MKNQTFEEESKAILKGLEKAYEKMIKFKKEKGTPLVVSDHGKVRHIPAKDIRETTTYAK